MPSKYVTKLNIKKLNNIKKQKNNVKNKKTKTKFTMKQEWKNCAFFAQQ